MATPLSVVVTTLNNASTLRVCLRSVAWAEDILVLDSFSTDDTCEIARSHGARVLQHEFQGYAKQKQMAIDKAANDWVLLLDADEAFSAGAADEIRALLAATPDADASTMARIEQILWRWTSQRVRMNHYSSGLVEHKARAGRAPSPWRCVVYPPLAFIKSYVFKRNFLNGWAGFKGSVWMALGPCTRGDVADAGGRGDAPRRGGWLIYRVGSGRGVARGRQSPRRVSRDAALSVTLRSAAAGGGERSVRCWCVSKGMAGMDSQTRGLAEALGARYEMHDAHMVFPWGWMPIRWVPRRLSACRGLPAVSKSSPPRLVISCGRHGVIPSLALKRRFGGRIFTVHIQDPKLDPAGFDLVIVPRHDGLRGANVYLTMGAMHYVTAAKLQAARVSPEAAAIRADERRLVTVLLGGPNRYYRFAEPEVASLAERLEALAEGPDVRLVILGSNRTPASAMARIAERFGERYFVWDGKGTNPYLAALACASYLVVTGDSVSMITEASATGRPVFVHHLHEQRPSTRFRDFHAMFERAGITRTFRGELDEWSYEPPDDTPKIAELIRERMAASDHENSQGSK